MLILFAANPIGVCENCLQTFTKASVPSMSLPLENEEAKAWGKPQTDSWASWEWME